MLGIYIWHVPVRTPQSSQRSTSVLLDVLECHCSEATQHNTAVLWRHHPLQQSQCYPCPAVRSQVKCQQWILAHSHKGGHFCYPPKCMPLGLWQRLKWGTNRSGRKPLTLATLVCECFSDYIMARQSASRPTTSLLFHCRVPNTWTAASRVLCST